MRALVARGVRFCVIGSFALQLWDLDLGEYQVPDLDLLVEKRLESLGPLVSELQARGYGVTLWEQPLPSPLTLTSLEGKYYLRARLRSLQVDCTYEHEPIPAREILEGLQWVKGFPLARAELILTIKRGQGRWSDRRLLTQIEGRQDLAPPGT